MTKSPFSMTLSVATPCGSAERVPEATIVSKEEEVAPFFAHEKF